MEFGVRFVLILLHLVIDCECTGTSKAAAIIEFSLGGNPMMFELVKEKIETINGYILKPTFPGLGVTVNWDFVRKYAQNPTAGLKYRIG